MRLLGSLRSDGIEIWLRSTNVLREDNIFIYKKSQKCHCASIKWPPMAASQFDAGAQVAK